LALVVDRWHLEAAGETAEAGLVWGTYDEPVTAEPMPGCRSLINLEPEARAHRVVAALRSIWP
jgi:hypothetical protein